MSVHVCVMVCVCVWVWVCVMVCVCVSVCSILTINVPLFKKLRDIIILGGENHFMSHFEGHFEGAKTFLTP